MLSSKSRKGRKLADRGNPSLSHDAVKLLKTQDAGYLQTMIQKTRRAIRKLEQEFVLRAGEGVDVLGGREQSGRGQHLIFVDDEEEQMQYGPKGRARAIPYQEKAPRLGGDEDEEEIEGDGKTTPPKSRQRLAKEALAAKEEKALQRSHRKEQNARKSKLAALKTREKDLRDAENELELQQAKMSNSVGGVTKTGVKWKVRERKS